MSFNAAETKDRLVQWIRDWFEINGKGCNAIVGISGGKDSSVVATLCVEALGKDRVIGIMMPQGVQSDIEYSQMLCDHLGIEHYTVNIFNACRDIKHEIRDELGGKWSKQSATNLPARIRMVTLYAFAQSMNGRVSCNCNLSEDWVGYATYGGDGFGSFAPLADLTVTEVKAKWAGRGFALCIGEWKLYVDDKDVTDKIPEDLRTESMNTYKRYERWYFKGWDVEWESYYDGLKQDEWIESNKYWLDEITTDIEIQRQIFKAINEQDFRPNSCGGCI